MLFSSWLRNLMPSSSPKRHVLGVARNPSGFRPRLEALERRDVPSFTPVIYSGSFAPTGPAVVADINHDGRPDLITLQHNSGSGYVFLNNGKGTFGVPLQFFDQGQMPAALAVGDVNGDGKLDIVLANTTSSDIYTSGTYTGSVTVLLGDGKGRFTYAAPSAQFIFPNAASSLALADVNGDGKVDIVAVPAYAGKLFVARSYGNGNFGLAQSYFVPPTLGSVSHKVAAGDINGDGKPDVVVTDPWVNSVSVLLNNGTGTFGAAQTYAVGGTPTALGVGNVNGDGKLDIVTANSNGTVSVLSGLGSGLFGPTHNYAIGGPATSVALGDFNQDRKSVG